MPTFSQMSLSKLATCHVDLQTLFHEVIKFFDCEILQGYRNKEEQDQAFKEGKTELQWPNGKHNHSPSNAVDVAPYPIEWGNIKRFYWFAGFVMGIAQKLKEKGKMTYSVRYGGDWDMSMEIDRNKFNDLVHFELVG